MAQDIGEGFAAFLKIAHRACGDMGREDEIITVAGKGKQGIIAR